MISSRHKQCNSTIVYVKIFFLFQDHVCVKEHYLFVVRECCRLFPCKEGVGTEVTGAVGCFI